MLKNKNLQNQNNKESNENKMKTMVAANGAVMIGLHVSNRGFMNYKDGVMDQCVK